MGEVGLRGSPRGGDVVRKFFPLYGAGWGWAKIKPCGVVAKIPSFCPSPLPSLR